MFAIMQTLINGYYSCVSYWFYLHLTYIKHKTNTYENCIVDAHIQLKEDVLSKTIYFGLIYKKKSKHV